MGKDQKNLKQNEKLLPTSDNIKLMNEPRSYSQSLLELTIEEILLKTYQPPTIMDINYVDINNPEMIEPQQKFEPIPLEIEKLLKKIQR